MEIKIPPRLRKGDLIGIVAPASPVEGVQRVEAGVKYLETLGYRTRVAQHVSNRLGYLAGTDEERTRDIHAMFADSEVKAIFCVRGGYGSPRLLSLLDYRLIARRPKIFVGYSDITALLLALWTKCRMVSFHGPMVGVEMAGSMDRATEESFWGMLTAPAREMSLGAGVMIDSSPAAAHPIHGRLVGGNLSLCVSLLGTPFQPDFRKALIFLEDTGEEPYRVDRMMTHLRNAGAFSVASAVLLGSFTDCTPKDPSAPTLSVDEVMRDNAAATGVVHARGFPFGHGLPLATFPVGVRAALYPDSGKLVLLEAPVS